MRNIEFIYKESVIRFLIGNEKNVMINANDIADAFGESLDQYLKKDSVNIFTETALKFKNEED